MTPETLSGIGVVAAAISAFMTILTFYVALKALRTWNDQIKFEVARRYRILLFRFRDELVNSLKSEQSSVEVYSLLKFNNDADDSEPGSRSRRLRAWNDHWGAASSKFFAITQELDAISYDVESIWGTEVSVAVNDLKQLGSELIEPMLLVAGSDDKDIDVDGIWSRYIDRYGSLDEDFEARLRAALAKAEAIVKCAAG